MRGSLSNHRKAQQRLKRNAQTISIEELRQKAVQTDIAHNEQLAQFQMRMLMLDLASTVSKQHMDVVKLKYQGHGVREIAGVLNLTVKEVRSILAQARDVLMELCYGCRLLPDANKYSLKWRRKTNEAVSSEKAETCQGY